MLVCKAYGCNDGAKLYGFCPRHYRWIYRNKGEIGWEETDKILELLYTYHKDYKTDNKCMVKNCEEDSRVRGFCTKHYMWLTLNKGDIPWDDTEELLKRIYEKHYEFQKCLDEGCPNDSRSYGFCAKHYQWLALNKGDISWEDKEKLCELIKSKHPDYANTITKEVIK